MRMQVLIPSPTYVIDAASDSSNQVQGRRQSFVYGPRKKHAPSSKMNPSHLVFLLSSSSLLLKPNCSGEDIIDYAPSTCLRALSYYLITARSARNMKYLIK